MAGLEDALFSLFEKKDEIQHWLSKKEKQFLSHYGSFDIRDAGWKAVVVDSMHFLQDSIILTLKIIQNYHFD